MSERPLSPHLSIYRWQITNTLSIIHRLTGFGLAIGTLLLTLWLYSAAYQPQFYYDLHVCMASWLGQAMLLGWTVAFYYHLANGIRHLLWDTGSGFTMRQVNFSGWFVVFFTVAMTAFSWGVAMGWRY